jgi:hypothetical protein
LFAVAASLICTFAVGMRSGSEALAQSIIGAHSMLQLNSPSGFMQDMFAEAAGMHASAIRLDVAPALVFTAPSAPPDFSGLDRVMTLSREYHLRVVGDLFTVPPWIAACPSSTSQPTRCGTDDLSEYRSMIAQIVAHADPVIRDWEIWNEPDTATYFDGTPGQYAWMLRVAHDAIKTIDPQANVLLGGISGTSGMGWLGQVFAVPGADAEHAFDVANVHERDQLDWLAPDIASWKHFLAGYGFSGPLWVTEHGYPSDPAFQYDPGYASGASSQAAFLTASIPTILQAGASAVFVTERDNLAGGFASEGVLGGDVLDPPVADPQPVEKSAYAAVRAIADCYSSLGRDCPGPAPAAPPVSLTVPATPLGSSTISPISVSNPGVDPLQLGTVVLAGQTSGSIAVQQDGCSNQLLEPAQTCTIAVWYWLQSGDATAQLQVPSDNGTLDVAVQAAAPSVSSLTSPQLTRPTFMLTRAADRVGRIERLGLSLTNPLSAPVHVTNPVLTGRNSHEFSVWSNTCAYAALTSGASCRMTVLFTPARHGTAQAVLVLHGDGTPLLIALRATSQQPRTCRRGVPRNTCHGT